LLPDAAAVHRSSISKARKKLPWQVFEDLSNKAASLELYSKVVFEGAMKK